MVSPEPSASAQPSGQELRAARALRARSSRIAVRKSASSLAARAACGSSRLAGMSISWCARRQGRSRPRPPPASSTYP